MKTVIPTQIAEAIDLTLIAAKVATIQSQNAHMVANGASLAFNTGQYLDFKRNATELNKMLSELTYRVQQLGVATEEDTLLINQCKEEIAFCEEQMKAHGSMAVLDAASLLVDGLKALKKRKDDAKDTKEGKNDKETSTEAIPTENSDK